MSFQIISNRDESKAREEIYRLGKSLFRCCNSYFTAGNFSMHVGEVF